MVCSATTETIRAAFQSTYFWDNGYKYYCVSSALTPKVVTESSPAIHCRVTVLGKFVFSPMGTTEFSVFEKRYLISRP